MNPEEIKRYFDANPPPQTVDWKPWAKITDTQLFLKSCYTGMRTFNGSLEMCPAWWHLRDFYLLVKKTQHPDASNPQALEHTVFREEEAVGGAETK